MTNRAVLYERTLQKYDPTPRKRLTTDEALRGLGLCLGCADNAPSIGSDYCPTCEAEDAHARALIARVHREADPAVREVQTKSLRTIFGIILRRSTP